MIVRTGRETPAFDVNQPDRQIGSFQANTALQVDVATTNAEKWLVIFTDPQDRKIRALCRRGDLRELLPAVPAAAAPPSGAPLAPASAGPLVAGSGALASLLPNGAVDALATNQFSQIAAALIASPNWSAHSSALSEWLRKSGGAANVQKPAWRRLFGLQRWCQLFAENESAMSSVEPDTQSWLLNDPALTEDFFAVLSPKDQVPAVLGILQDLHKAEPARFPLFNRLAIALAVVWDSPPPVTPHFQVASGQIPQDRPSLVERYRFWLELNDKKIADYDLSKLEVEQLKFLVDAALALDELRWCQQSARFGKGNLGSAFASINYDEPRLLSGQYNWPRDVPYTLKEIRKRGGICVDQAYFAAMAGKAMGIPTLFFTGEGRRGPHAWFGYMKSPDRWVMDCGRYAYDKFATGTARDPQSGDAISDHELAFLAEPFRNTPEYQTSMCHLGLARLCQAASDPARALQAAEAAVAVCRRNLNAWELKSSLLEPDAAAQTAYQTHLGAMMAEFVRYPDIKVACQERLAAAARKKGDEKAAAQIENRMVQDNRLKRHDLSAEVFEKQLTECCEKQDWKGGRTVLRSAFSKLKDETGPLLTLTKRLVEALLLNGQAEEANRVLMEFRSRIDMDPIVTREFDALQAAVKQVVKEQRKNK